MRYLQATFTLSIVFLSLTGAICSHAEGMAAPPDDRPNVLFISVDDLNDWVGYMGGHPQAQTPNLDRLAESSVAFVNAYPSAPVCGPARTALLYGRYPHSTGAYGNNVFYSPETLDRYGRTSVIPDIFDSQKSLPTAFRENGYYTAGAGKLSHFSTHYHYPEHSSYFEDDFHVYFNSNERVIPDPDNPESDRRRLPIGPVAPEDEERLLDTRFSDWAVDQLQKEHDRPFFLAIGFKKPHLPWVAPQSYFDRFDLDEIQLPEVPEDDLDDVPHAGKIFAQSLFGFEPHYSQSDHQTITKHPGLWERLVRAYLASTSYADAMIGKVLEALEASPYADNTIIVLWGDHGWHLGEKKSWRKMTMWERSSRTPLIIRVPGSPGNGEIVSPPVSLQDIYPTLVELADLDIDQHLDGNSLVPLLEDPHRSWDEPALMAHGPGNFAVRSGPWRYIRYQNGDEELYNLETDPNEFTNLALRDTYEHVKEKLSKHIPKEYVTLYDHRFLQFSNVDTMTVLIE